MCLQCRLEVTRSGVGPEDWLVWVIWAGFGEGAWPPVLWSLWDHGGRGVFPAGGQGQREASGSGLMSLNVKGMILAGPGRDRQPATL